MNHLLAERQELIAKGQCRCTKCKNVHPLADFSVRRKTLDGIAYGYHCKFCQRSYNKKIKERSFESPEALIKFKLNKAIRRSLKPNSITLDEALAIYQQQNHLCFYTNQQMVLKPGRHPNNISIDRIDSTKGYTKDNVVFCRWVINRMKSNLTQQDFLDICRQITETPKSSGIHAASTCDSDSDVHAERPK